MQRLGIVILLLVPLLGCGGSSSTSKSAQTLNMTGIWLITAQSTVTPGIQFSGLAVITDGGPGSAAPNQQSGIAQDTLTGSYTTQTSPCFTAAIFTGTLEQNGYMQAAITNGPVFNSTESVLLSGNVTSNNKASGQYNGLGVCMNGDAGTWQAVKQQ